MSTGSDQAPMAQRARDVWVDGLIAAMIGLQPNLWQHKCAFSYDENAFAASRQPLYLDHAHDGLAVVQPDLWRHNCAVAWRRKSTGSSSQHPQFAVQHCCCFGTPV